MKNVLVIISARNGWTWTIIIQLLPYCTSGIIHMCKFHEKLLFAKYFNIHGYLILQFPRMPIASRLYGHLSTHIGSEWHSLKASPSDKTRVPHICSVNTPSESTISILAQLSCILKNLCKNGQ